MTFKKVETSWDAGMVEISFCWFFSMLFLFVYKSLIKADNTRETWFWMDFWQKSMVFYGSESIFQHQKISNFGAVWVVTKIFYELKLFRFMISILSHYFTAEIRFMCRKECPSMYTEKAKTRFEIWFFILILCMFSFCWTICYRFNFYRLNFYRIL